MSLTPTKISELLEASPKLMAGDQFIVARGAGMSSETYKVYASELINQAIKYTLSSFNVQDSSTVDLTWNSSTRTLNADVKSTAINYQDSPTVDLTWNSSTRTLSADVKQNAITFNIQDSPTVDLTWNSSTRTLSADVKGGLVLISDTPPPSPQPLGTLWYDSNSAILSIYYNDGSSTQWVDTAAGGDGPQGIQGIQGFTGVGTQGFAGVQGSSGLQGRTGSVGLVGPQGIQGWQGLQGPGGCSGTGSGGGVGPQGLQGPAGTGIQGIQGPAGSGGSGIGGGDGAQGTQGTQGVQGPAGSGGGGGGGSGGSSGPFTFSLIDETKPFITPGINHGSINNYFYLMREGSLKASGNNRHGSLGQGRSNENVGFPNICAFSPPLNNGVKIDKVVATGYSSYALTTTGEVYATGYNAQGQLGLGNVVNASVFTKITLGISGKTIKDICTGTGNQPRNFLLMLATDGTVYGCGDNARGALGNGSTGNITTPTLMTSNTTGVIKQILVTGGGQSGSDGAHVGKSTTFLLNNNGELFSAGANGNGQLGRGTPTTTDQRLMKKITFPNSAMIEKIWGGGDLDVCTMFALATDKKVYAWGYNDRNRNRNATGWGGSTASNDVTTPREITDLNGSPTSYVEDIIGCVDSTSICLHAKFSNGIIKSWGQNTFGELGNGNVSPVLTPTRLWASGNVVDTNIQDLAVATGSGTGACTSVILNNGHIYGAGYNVYGLVGDGSTTNTSTFKRACFNANVGVPKKIVSMNNDVGNQQCFLIALDNGLVFGWGFQNAASSFGTDISPNSELTPSLVKLSN